MTTKRRTARGRQAKDVLQQLGNNGPAPTEHPQRLTDQVTTELTDSLDAGDQAVTSPLQQEGRKALALRLTEEIKQDYHKAIRKLGRMHAEKLWQELRYASFEEYVLLEFGKTRKWGYDELTRLRAVEYLESKGVTDPLQNLSKEAALVFRKWEFRPEVFVLAYQQIVERDEQPTQERLEKECHVQSDYLHEASQTPDLTQEEYRSYQTLDALPYTYQLDKDFQSAGELVEACRSLKRRPPLKAMARVARGADLVVLVRELEPLCAEAAKLKGLKEKKAGLEKQKREKIKELADELQKVEDEIAKAEGKGDDPGVEEGDEDAGTGDTTSALRNPLLTDLETDPQAFLDDAATRMELVASHARLLRAIKDAVSALLDRMSSALDRMRISLGDDATPATEQDIDLNQYQPEEIP
jgi:hypothetical protein